MGQEYPLTIDNLRKRGFILIEWCCMCKNSDETVDHLLLRCEFARDLLNYFFSKMGFAWVVMPERVANLLASWRGIKGMPHYVSIIGSIISCKSLILGRQQKKSVEILQIKIASYSNRQWRYG